MTGLDGPFRVRTDSSEFRATINTSPSWLAASRYRMWPTWSKSKQPLVRTMFLPWDLSWAEMVAACSSVTSLFTVPSLSFSCSDPNNANHQVTKYTKATPAMLRPPSALGVLVVNLSCSSIPRQFLFDFLGRYCRGALLHHHESAGDVCQSGGFIR